MVLIFGFIRLTHLQIQSVQLELKNALASIVDISMRLENESGLRRTQAEAEYERTFFNPDGSSSSLMTDVQSSVDSIFDLVAAEGEISSTAEQKISLGGSKFSKAVEAISGLHQDIAQPLVEMMSVLSVENQVGQRLLHASQCAKFFLEELSELQSRFGASVPGHELAACAERAHSYLLLKWNLPEETRIYEAAFEYQRQDSFAKLKGTEAEFYAFAGDFALLYARQLDGIFKLLLAAFELVMSNVLKISSVNEDKKKHADTKFIADASNQGRFVKASIKESVTEQSGAEESLGTATTALDSLSDGLNHALFDVISKLSFEDILGQRLRHVISSCARFQSLICDLRLNTHKPADASEQGQQTEEFLKKIFNEFVMEDERRCFREAFERSAS